MARAIDVSTPARRGVAERPSDSEFGDDTSYHRSTATRPVAAEAIMAVSSFQRLAITTTAITYLLILVGGLVRASGAGLGCPDWPRCFGGWIPPASAADLPAGFDPSQFNQALMWTEYLNRLLGVTVGLFIFATLISAYRHHRHTPRVFRPMVAAFLLTGFQGWLGGKVVSSELAGWIVTVHMIVALVIVALLIYATFHAVVGPAAAASVGQDRRWLGRATYVVTAVMLVQVAVGAQVREAVDHLVDELPRGDVMAALGTVDLLHRDGAVLMLGLVVLLWFRVWLKHRHEPALMRIAWVAVALVSAQIATGIALAYFAIPPPAQVAHLTLAALLMGALMVLALAAYRLPERREAA
jgi:heme a synthase